MEKHCIKCGKPFTPSKFTPYQIYCTSQCNQRAYNKRRRKNLDKERRLEAIYSLGAKCKLCGTEDIFILCLDHINDDRYKDKERWSGDRVRNLWIINNVEMALKIFQVLCFNCNNLKSNHPEEFQRRWDEKFK